MDDYLRQSADVSVDTAVMGAAGSPDDEAQLQLSQLAEISVDADNLLQETTQRGKIHRFPHYLRGIRGEDDRYVVPSVVALGPYHHHKPHLNKMEKVKHHAARKLCERAGLSVDDLYAKVLRDARNDNWRSLYEESALAKLELTDDAFARMMVWDGCFLLWFMTCAGDPILAAYMQSCGQAIVKDIFLLENQIPLVVLHPIAAAVGISAVHVIAANSNGTGTALYETVVVVETEKWKRLWGCIPFPSHQIESNENESSMQDTEEESPLPPLHLLDFLRFRLLGGMPPKQRRGTLDFDRVADRQGRNIGAVKLVESGVKLTASTARWFSDTKCKMNFFFAELSLSRLNLNDTTACWLVNMVALESLNATTLAKWWEDGCVITTYVCIMALLMDREEDVRQLRKSGVMVSSFSDAQTLAFFKDLRQPLRAGYNYRNTLAEVNSYMSRRSWRIAVYKFFYNHYKTVAAILSVAGVLISILKALYSIKRA